MGDKEVYGFVKQDTKRAYYILKELVKNRKDVFLDIATKHNAEKK
ncbi:plasmid partition family protein [Borreliella valaisiana]|nr:plasmid partition family protein [Borreliella valaisiana]